jgi:hypothetical protein
MSGVRKISGFNRNMLCTTCSHWVTVSTASSARFMSWWSARMRPVASLVTHEEGHRARVCNTGPPPCHHRVTILDPRLGHVAFTRLRHQDSRSQSRMLEGGVPRSSSTLGPVPLYRRQDCIRRSTQQTHRLVRSGQMGANGPS